MRKFMFFFFCGLIIGFVFTACDNKSIPYNDPEKTLVCLGDSLTAGYGASIPGADDASKSYPAYLQKKVNLPVINAGISGDTAEEALKRIETDVLSKNPRIIIIELGANDLFHAVLPGHGEISLDTISSVISRTRENLRGIINQIDDGNRKIYVAKFYTESIVRNFLDDNMGSLRDAFDSFIDIAASMLIYQYDRMFETLAESTHIELINDIWDGVWGEYMSDIVHPNARGYEIMADNYFNAIQPYLREHNLLK